MTRKPGTGPTLLAEAQGMPAGVIRLMELQDQGGPISSPDRGLRCASGRLTLSHDCERGTEP